MSFVISTTGLQAQNTDTAKADKLYERYEFVSAAEQYTKLVDQGDKLVEALKANPTMVIMVKAHTDNRGSDVYNMRLSDRRAKSSVQYILLKGIGKDKISGKGYGESEPKVDCGADCTEAEHAENRRSEFIIVKK